MVLRGRNDQFNAVLQEELKERAAVLIETVYKAEAKKALELQNIVAQSQQKVQENVQISAPFVESLVLKDGNTIQLTNEQYNDICKLYKSLNNDNKERMLKLLSESQQSVNRVLNLAKNNRG
jgi:hypothetical protein